MATQTLRQTPPPLLTQTNMNNLATLFNPQAALQFMDAPLVSAIHEYQVKEIIKQHYSIFIREAEMALLKMKYCEHFLGGVSLFLGISSLFSFCDTLNMVQKRMSLLTSMQNDLSFLKLFKILKLDTFWQKCQSNIQRKLSFIILFILNHH